MKRSELKANAREQLRGNWLWAVGLCLVGAIMASLTSSFSIGILGGGFIWCYLYIFSLGSGKKMKIFLVLCSLDLLVVSFCQRY